MKVLDPGHRYLLGNLDETGTDHRSVLQFVKRVGDGYPGNEPPAYGGTTMQEVLRALIDRAAYVDNQSPCWETQAAHRFMVAALELLEQRVRRVRDQPPLPDGTDVVSAECCPTCGHVECLSHPTAQSSGR